MKRIWINQITSEDVSKRAQVHQLAPTNPYVALRMAQSIPHPWYRCQSLSNVAEYIKDPERQLMILNEAFEVAQIQEEINRIVTVSAWPLKILASIHQEEAKKQLRYLMLQAEKESHPIRRADAIFALFMAVKGSSNLLEIVIPALVRSLLSGHGWKIDRQIRFLVTILTREHIFKEMVDSLIAHHRDNREKRRLMTSLAKLGASNEYQ